MTAPNNGRIFISYRRADSAAWAGRIYDRLSEHFGKEAVFMDVDTIDAGLDFVEVLQNAVQSCDVLIALIGKQWLTMKDKSGKRRLDSPEDFVHIEIAAALDRGIRVIPVLVDDASMPYSTELPEGIQPLARRNAIQINHQAFNADTNRLITQLERALGAVETTSRTKAESLQEERERIQGHSPLHKRERKTGKDSKGQKTYSRNRKLPYLIGGGIILLLLLTFVINSFDLLRSEPGNTETPSILISETPPPPKTSPTPTNTSEFPAGYTKISPEDSMPMVYVPSGNFQMGSDAGASFEKPIHTIYLDAYWIDQTEVTNGMYAKCVEAGSCNEPKESNSYTRDSYYDNREFDNYPVVNVSWEDANKYCGWVGRRLPTEAEWEKAAGWNEDQKSKQAYPWGNAFDGEIVNFCDGNCPFEDSKYADFDDGYADTSPVVSYEDGRSYYGVYNMAGNVWEWVGDWYASDYYENSPESNPLGPETGENRVLRGGSWRQTFDRLRVAYRVGRAPAVFDSSWGFRCAESSISETANNSEPEITSPSNPMIGSTWLQSLDGMLMVYVPAGEFQMGSDELDNAKPVHTVYLEAYWIDQTEVTNAMYVKCIAEGACDEPEGKSSFSRDHYFGNWEYDDYPVINVTWEDANNYCGWAGRRLPTEAEWEKAARGTDSRTYPWGEEIDSTYLNYRKFIGDTTAVGDYPKGISPYGAYDMAGNVWEWVGDWYTNDYYASSPALNPLGPEAGTLQVRGARGGSWQSAGSSLSSAARGRYEPLTADSALGFRCALGVGSIKTSEIDNMVMNYIPAGEFQMGSDADDALMECEKYRTDCERDWFASEEPIHTVYLDAYWIDQTEVTNTMYAKCVESGGCKAPSQNKSAKKEMYFDNPEFGNYPVIYVSWENANNYCAWAGRRLPTEAEWEKAARGGLGGENYPWGQDGPVCKYEAENGSNFGKCIWDTESVASYLPNIYGLYDMSGNVWEWVGDWYASDYYSSENRSNPSGPQVGESRVLRGGSWFSDGYSLRVASRGSKSPNETAFDWGFRCVQDAE